MRAGTALPAGVDPQLGPDATGLGWVYQYVLYPGRYCPAHPGGAWWDAESGAWYASPGGGSPEKREDLQRVRAFDDPGTCPLDGNALVPADQDLASLRSIQDWYLRFELKVRGRAEVASIGGFVKEYQVVVDPVRLRGFGLALEDIARVIGESNREVGGSVIETAENEYMVRSRGYIRGLDDLGRAALGRDEHGKPGVPPGAWRRSRSGASRGAAIGEWNGKGEAGGGVIVSRFGENAYKVIRDVKAKIAEIEPGLPPGVAVKTSYDRSALIERSIDTLRETLIEEILVVGLLCNPLPPPREERARRDLHGAGRSARELRRHALPGDQREHHEPGRHRHSHRRHGGQLRGDGGERPQAPRCGGGARATQGSPRVRSRR
jgi:Cu(I)/Ag(I) efflux system membrane protein CusA/SilA